MRNGSYKLTTGIRVRELGDETLVLDDRNGKIHQLNPTASFIWRQLDGETSVSTITNRLVEKYDVDESVAADDVAEIVDRLRELQLLDD
jgi:hypothetical protein